MNRPHETSSPLPTALRAVVIGSSCAGKSTFAQELAQRSAVPRIDLDELHWGPNWTEKPDEEFRHLVQVAAAEERWVADGNYRIVRDILWPRATTVVWLNYGFVRVFSRGLWRTIERCVTQRRLFHGNRESIRRAFFSTDSILLWILRTYDRHRREFQELRASPTYGHLHWIELQQPREADACLDRLSRELSATRLSSEAP